MADLTGRDIGLFMNEVWRPYQEDRLIFPCSGLLVYLSCSDNRIGRVNMMFHVEHHNFSWSLSHLGEVWSIFSSSIKMRLAIRSCPRITGGDFLLVIFIDQVQLKG